MRYSAGMKAQLIFNPVAGPRDLSDEVAQVQEYLRSQGWQVELRRTLGPGDATTFAREAASTGYELVVAVGGDGTLGEVVGGLVGSRCMLGLLPAGTGNVWAHMLGVPVWTPSNRTALLDAARILVEGQPRLVDLGRADARYFLLWAGVGLDAQVAREVEPYRDMRRSLGNFTYLISAIVLALNMRGNRMTVVVDGAARRQRAIMVVVSNIQLYGPSWRLAPQAQLDDGWLDVYVFKGRGILDVLRVVFLILAGKHQLDPKIETYRARHVEIRADRRIPFHLDGEPVGITPIRVEVVPRALRVIVPSWVSESLFMDGQPESLL
jgi:diacylglycerol kinase (ATP)